MAEEIQVLVDDTQEEVSIYVGTPSEGVQSVVAGTNISVDNTDPKNPIVSSTGSGGVQSVSGSMVDNTDPSNPVINSDSTKQDTLVSGTNIKTVNGNSLLGSGDIAFQATVTPDTATEITLYPFGNFCNSETPNTEDTISVVYTNALTPAGEWAKILIDTTGKATFPTIGTGVRILNGDAFEANEKYVAKIYHDGFALCVQFIKVIYDNSYDFSTSLLFITSPTPRTEIQNGDTLNPTVTAENASSVEFYYKNSSGTWVKIDDAVNSSGDVWEIATWSPTVVATAIKAVATYPDATTQETVTILYSFSLYDTFTDTNGTLLSAHTPNSKLGDGWTIESGNWQIQSNLLSISTADTNLHFVYKDLGTTNAIIRVKINSSVLGGTHQMVLRYVDADNHIVVIINKEGKILIGERTAGVYTNIYTGTDGEYSYGSLLEIWFIDNSMNIVLNNIPKLQITITQHPTGTKYGLGRGAANYQPKYDEVTMIPITLPETTNAVSYTATKSNTFVVQKNWMPPTDAGGVAGQSIVTIGSTNYMVFACRNNSGSFVGLSYATSPTSDKHNWTRYAGLIVTAGAKSIADSATYWDGSNFYVLYSDRLTGKIYYRMGADLESLGAETKIIDLTGSGIYARHPAVLVKDGVWYVYFDTRLDQPSGEFGDIWVCSGADLESLTGYKQILSTPAFAYEQCDLTAPDVRYNAANGYFEMLYSGYKGGGELPYYHQTGLAICKNPAGKFVRIDSVPLIANGGSGSIDETHVHDPIWFPNSDIVYYVANDSVYGTTDSYDGITYATLTET